MQASSDDEKEVNRTPVTVLIALSCHIKCYRSFHQGVFDHLAAFAHPIIFNIRVFLSHELVAGFLAAGAKCSSPTLWSVGDKTAMNAALTFHDSAMADRNILTAFSAMLQSIKNDLYRHIYILWGLHFTSFPHPSTKSDDRIIAGLLATYSLLLRKVTATQDDEVRRILCPLFDFYSRRSMGA